MTLKLRSAVFEDGERIPERYTCDDENISPPLEWQAVPDDARSLVIICEDPDAPDMTWSHWVLYNLPPDINELEANVPPVASLSNDALQGLNDFGDLGYGGPCPPGEEVHHYHFRLFALETKLDLEAGESREEILERIRPYLLEEANLMGTYGSAQGEV